MHWNSSTGLVKITEICRLWHNLFAKKKTNERHFLALHKTARLLKLAARLHLQFLSKFIVAGVLLDDSATITTKANIVQNHTI